MPEQPNTPRQDMLAPLVRQWQSKLMAAYKAKQPFNDIAKQLDSFFRKSSGFMWKDEFKSQFMGAGVQTPKFQITLNKAFELVALFGPYLYWKNPYRHCSTYDPLEYQPSAFGNPQDPQVQQAYQMAVMEDKVDEERAQLRCDVMSKYLNYSQREQAYGGLAVHAELAITEALVKGRGVLSIEMDERPGSDRQMTGCFFRSVDDLLIDPDCKDPTLRTAKWIALRHVTPSWELERRMKLAKGSLEGKGDYQSIEAFSQDGDAYGKANRADGKTNDLIVWYEIWSKNGVGARMSDNIDPEAEVGRRHIGAGLHDQFDKVVGDFAYLCISESVPYFLNCPERKLKTSYDDEIQECFQWRSAGYGKPFPAYLDNRWPLAVLDFYRHHGSAWPLAPMAPALGELVAMNVLISSLTEQAYDNRKTIVAYLEEYAKDARSAITGSESPAFVAITEQSQRSINEIIQIMKRPEMNKDILTALDYLSVLFDKRTFLSEIMYAMNVGGTQSRSATDSKMKEEKSMIVPERMASHVAQFMTQCADLEKFLAGWNVEGEHLKPLLGKWGSIFWDQLIANEDPELYVREMRATVEAEDVRKPNKSRTAENLQSMLQPIMPVLQQYAIDTGDTSQLNDFVASLGDSIEQDTSAWRLGPWKPVPSEQEQQAMQHEQAMEQQKQKAEQEKVMAEVQLKQMDMELKSFDAYLKQLDIQAKQQEAQFKGAEQQGKLAGQQLTLQFDQQKNELALVTDQAMHLQDLTQDQESHVLDLTQDQQAFTQKLMQEREMAKAKIEAARSMAAAKPKPTSGGSSSGK